MIAELGGEASYHVFIAVFLLLSIMKKWKMKEEWVRYTISKLWHVSSKWSFKEKVIQILSFSKRKWEVHGGLVCHQRKRHCVGVEAPVPWCREGTLCTYLHGKLSSSDMGTSFNSTTYLCGIIGPKQMCLYKFCNSSLKFIRGRKSK